MPSTKRLYIRDSASAWQYVFTLLGKGNFVQKHVDSATAQEVNAVLAMADLEQYTAPQLETIRYDLLRERSTQFEAKHRRLTSDIKAKHFMLYDDGMSISDISTQEDMPPLAVAKHILEGYRCPSQVIQGISTSTDCLKFIRKSENKMPPPLFSTLEGIVARGLTYWPRPGTAFEEKVMQFLKSVNVQFAVVNSPCRHLLVQNDLTIEGSKVKWISTRDSVYGANTSDTDQCLTQCKQLIGEYDTPGAVIFSLGFIEENEYRLEHPVVFVDFRLLALAPGT
jgi:hypothetical protein